MNEWYLLVLFGRRHTISYLSRYRDIYEFVKAFKSRVYQFICLHLQPLVISPITSWHSETQPQGFRMVVQLITLLFTLIDNFLLKNGTGLAQWHENRAILIRCLTVGK